MSLTTSTVGCSSDSWASCFQWINQSIADYASSKYIEHTMSRGRA